MRPWGVFTLGTALLGVAACTTPPPRAPSREGALSTEQFRNLMQTVADGWNEGNSRKSANCFSEGAIYMEPPDAQFYEGRESLYEFFGGKQQPPSPGRMTWHHVLFDEAAQVGAGEYTYQGNRRYHGIVMVRVRAGKIDRWREYQQPSTLNWTEFTGKSHF
ncbi:nuclear transport factor 2 family protein [Pendulispora brunnea]|uniref:Nuclear transport factor 2 family protein n=1 Tax=Pendulispora brunnea TaxID=2905690 RepID=A0ABZ2KMN0_9BACT